MNVNHTIPNTHINAYKYKKHNIQNTNTNTINTSINTNTNTNTKTDGSQSLYSEHTSVLTSLQVVLVLGDSVTNHRETNK